MDADAATPSPTAPSQPSSIEDLTEVTVEPARFIDAVQAAFDVGEYYRNPHDEVLLALVEWLNAPTSLGLPDPFAPAMKVLANAIFGPSRAYWDEATAVFRRRYLRALRLKPETAPDKVTREVDAAVLRWRTLLILAGKAPDAMRDWFEWIPADLYAQCPPFQGRHRAAAMVYSAAGTALWQDDSQDPTSDDRYVFNLEALAFVTNVMGGGVASYGVNDHAINAIWRGLFDQRLIASRQAFSSLTQRFLAYLVILVGSKGTTPAKTYRVRADDLIEWAQVDSQSVRVAFAASDTNRSPAHEIHGHPVALPDWHWSDFADPQSVVMPWFSELPHGGHHDGCLWQEVTINQELLPYLRRLYLCLGRLPLTAETYKN